VGEMTISRVQRVIISFELLAAMVPVDMVDDSADKILNGTLHADIMDAHHGARVGHNRRSPPTCCPPVYTGPVGYRGHRR
jgi:hypothetical protein